jgi:hypothetical protein
MKKLPTAKRVTGVSCEGKAVCRRAELWPMVQTWRFRKGAPKQSRGSQTVLHVGNCRRVRHCARSGAPDQERRISSLVGNGLASGTGATLLCVRCFSLMPAMVARQRWAPREKPGRESVG